MDLYGLMYKRWMLSIADELPGQPAGSVYLLSRTATEDISESMPTTIRSSYGFGDDEAATGPGANGPDTLSFEAEFQAEHSLDDLRPIRETLLKMRRNEPSLNRKPLLVFRWAMICDTYWMQSCDVTWEGGLFPGSGYPIRARVKITLVRAVAHAMSDERQGEVRSTFYHSLGAGETPEHLALRYLGDPTYGPKIRQTNPAVEEVEGASYVVLPREHPKMAGPVKPIAVPFVADGWEDVFEARAGVVG